MSSIISGKEGIADRIVTDAVRWQVERMSNCYPGSFAGWRSMKSEL